MIWLKPKTEHTFNSHVYWVCLFGHYNSSPNKLQIPRQGVLWEPTGQKPGSGSMCEALQFLAPQQLQLTLHPYQTESQFET